MNFFLLNKWLYFYKKILHSVALSFKQFCASCSFCDLGRRGLLLHYINIIKQRYDNLWITF